MASIDDLSADVDHAIKLNGDLEYFAAETLRLRPKAGGLEPFVFNEAQRKLHAMLEDQKKKTGRVRAIILKARQLGISTYISARYFSQTIRTPGIRTFILGHEKPASTNLYQLVRRFHDNLPEEMKPAVGVSNSEELNFSQIDSGYLVGVAGPEGAGRSATAQLLHGSEVAFWQNLQEQFASLMQIVPDIDGSEILLESTGNQYGDSFHQLWRRAESGDSEFMPVFLAWNLDVAYRAKLPKDFSRARTKPVARGTISTTSRCAWRRNKISQLGSLDYFQREYPLTPDEAFMSSQFDSFITADLVMAARKTSDIEPYGPLLIGVDPAGQGDDATAVAWRRVTPSPRSRSGIGSRRWRSRAGLRRSSATRSRQRSTIDVGGLGIGIYERLMEQGFNSSVVVATNFGSKPIEPPPLDETGKPFAEDLRTDAPSCGST